MQDHRGFTFLDMTGNEKIILAEDLEKKLPALRRGGKRIGFTNGCFDILHAGHVRYLEEARGHCDILVVGLNSDSSVKSIKGDKRPVNGERARAEVLAGLFSVDFVTLFSEDTPEKLIRRLMPDIIFKGGDWKEDDVLGSDFVKARGGNVKIIDYVEGFSTTGIIEKMSRVEDKP